MRSSTSGIEKNNTKKVGRVFSYLKVLFSGFHHVPYMEFSSVVYGMGGVIGGIV